MSKRSLVIVESPTKAKTISKFLPASFVVRASMGHLRDLPKTASDVPLKYKQESWARLGVNVENNFEPLYVTVKGKSKIITELRQLLKQADVLYLATDEDREGESISWHLIELLKPKIPVKRMVFHEITKTAITDALHNSRDIDERLVKAQEARRILDRLYGFTLSPVIWKQIAYGLSAGRVQSVGLKLLVSRERERFDFVKANYWDLKAGLSKDGEAFEAKLISVNDKKIATGKDFDEKTGKLKKPGEVVVLDKAQADDLVKKVKNSNWVVASVEQKEFSAKPPIPFITSTLQQEGNKKLGLSARDTMRVAQGLYEQGLITYMRTDSPNLSQQAIQAARYAVESLYGKEYLSQSPRQFASKSKNAQEAHEAIRPSGESFVHPDKTGLSGKDKALYDLIWKRTVATQMSEAKKQSMSVKIDVDQSVFQANGTRILFPGFLRAYVEGTDSPEEALEGKEVILPDLKQKDSLKVHQVDPLSHETKPIARFTEASLVQRLEKEEVGRPSTYASIIGTLIERGYAKKAGNALVPTFTGFAVSQLLEKHFSQFVDYKFTSKMENALDEIAAGERPWLEFLKEFYSGSEGVQKLVERKEKNIDPEESRRIDLLNLKNVDIRVGRFGPYLVKTGGSEEVRASIPEDIAPSEITEEKVEEIITMAEKGPESIGKHPETGEQIYCLLGRFGPYLQLGEVTDDNPKPRRASIPKGTDYQNISLEEALKLLSLPRDLGAHPVSGETVIANRGRFGPYIGCAGDFRSLKKEDDVFTVTLERALELLSQEKKSRGGAKTLKDFGMHPDTNKKIAILDGKYGPYVKYGTKNISLPQGDKKPEDYKLEEILPLLDAKSGKKKAKKKSARKS